MSIRRIVLVDPGHTWSTYDAFTGLHRGFTLTGIQSFPYALERRLPLARNWLSYTRASAGRLDEPGDDEVICVAGQESVLQALAVGAEAVVVVSGLLYDPRLYAMLARARIPVFVFGTESPYNDDFYEGIAPMVAAFSTNEATSVERLEGAARARGSDTRVIHMPLGYDPERHFPGVGKDADLSAHDVVFVGNVYPSRARMLEAVDWSGVDVALYGVFRMLDRSSRLWRYVIGATPDHPEMAIDNRATAALYDRAKITLNLFRTEKIGHGWDDVTDVDGGESINPRMIEAAACGAFMISEYRPEVERTFGPLVPTFRSSDELQRLVHYYLEHDDERRAIADQLPAAVAGFSYHDRAREIAGVLTRIRQDMGLSPLVQPAPVL